MFFISLLKFTSSVKLAPSKVNRFEFSITYKPSKNTIPLKSLPLNNCCQLLKSINKLLVISALKIPTSVAAYIILLEIIVSFIFTEEELFPIK